jgi:hypothetical protein
MARLPSAQDLGERPTPRPAGGIASYTPSRDNLGAQVSEAGQEVIQASRILEESNARQDTIAAEAALNKLQEQRLTLEHDEQTGFRRVKEGGAVGQKFMDDYLGRFNQAASLIEEGLSNENQKALFKQRIPVVGLQYRASLMEHQSRQTDAFNDSTERGAIELQLQSAAMRPDDEVGLQTSLVRINATVDRMAERKGLSTEEASVLKGEYGSAAYAARVQSHLIGIPGVVDANPYTALAMIERDREKMLPDTVLDLTHKAMSSIRMLENQRRIEQDRALKDAEQEVKGLAEFAMTGANPDDAYESQVLMKTAGTPFEPQARQLLQQAKAGAMHGSQSIPQQQASIRTAEAALANGTSPEAEKLIARARQITATQEAAYKENPWAASARFQRLPAVPDVPLPSAEDVPSYVAKVLPMMSVVETAGGAPVSPLQPAQAKAFVDQLQALPVGPRSEVLAKTGQLLDAPRVDVLAEQLDHANRPLALSLKLGSAGTTAGRMVSELVLRGADAIRDKAVKRDDATLTGWRAELSRMVGGALGNSKDEKDVIDAAYYVRVAMEHEGSAVPGFELTASNENAVKMVIGQPVERAGVKTILPRGMDEHQFDFRLRQYTPDKLALYAPAHAVWVRGQQRSLASLSSALPSMGLRRDADGRYIPVSAGAPVTIDEAGTQLLRLEVAP